MALTVTPPNEYLGDGVVVRSLFSGGIDCAGATYCNSAALITGTWNLAPGQVQTASFTYTVNSGGSAPPIGTLIGSMARVDYLNGDLSQGRVVVVGP